MAEVPTALRIRAAARRCKVPVERRFPPPWTAEETDACFIVKDHNGMAVAYVYFEDEPGRRTAANLLTRDEARRIAANIAKLPELVSPKRQIPPYFGFGAASLSGI